MVLTNVWKDIDRVAFFENAILLELKRRSQGMCVKMQMSNTSALHASRSAELYPYPVQDLLDDIALVASGSGGADNVTAACLEIRDLHKRVMIVRLARNSGISQQLLKEIRNLLEEVKQECKAGSSDEAAREIVRSHTVRCCRSRFKKHISNLNRTLSAVQPCDYFDLTPLPVDTTLDSEESPEDVRELGKYDESTHTAYLKKQQERLREIQDLTANAASDFTSTKIQDLESLIDLAYQVHKSSTFRRLIHQSLRERCSQKFRTANMAELVERLGQLSKFARVASTLTKHVRKMVEMDITLLTEHAPSRKIEISELSERSAKQLRMRGGMRFANFRENQLRSMIARWPAYREHAEIQLIMFYEEHPARVLHTRYIGCNKQSCFMCFNFITQHGRFHVSGCHQSLYSLWAVRAFVNFEDDAAAMRVKNSLSHLSEVLHKKVEALRSPSGRRLGGGTGKESIANLSRVSVAFSDDNPGVISVAQDNTMGDSIHRRDNSPLSSSSLGTVIESDEFSAGPYQIYSGDKTEEALRMRKSSRLDCTSNSQTLTTFRDDISFRKDNQSKHKRRRHQGFNGISASRNGYAEKRSALHRKRSRRSSEKTARRRHFDIRRRPENLSAKEPGRTVTVIRKLIRFVVKLLFGTNSATSRQARVIKI